MRSVVLTVDYEIFGNGAGDVVQHVTDPTERMARLCREHEMPLTVFFEMEEYLAFERHRDELQRTLRYDPARLIRGQVVQLARDGHDFQLHLHPQWYGAELKDGKWKLHFDKLTVDALFETQEETNHYIGERKQLLEDILSKAGAERKVMVYRAGGFAAQPGTKLLRALAANGIGADSSVVQGLTRDSAHVRLDYRNAPSAKEPWRVSRDVAEEDSAGSVWEVPIYSRMRRRFQQMTWHRLRAKFSGNVPKEQQYEMVQQLGVGRNPWKALKFLLQPVPIKLDFHNLPPRTLLRWIKSAPAPANGLPDIVVLIGHSKEHIDDAAFATFLSLVANEPDLKVVSFSEIAALLKKKAEPQVHKAVEQTELCARSA